MPDFSVVTIVKGRRQQLANLLDSIERSSLRPSDIQIVCMDTVDDVSVPAVLPVTLHALTESGNLPLAAARNTGIAAAQTDTVIFIDVDCIVSPSLFEHMLAALTDDAIIAAYPLYLKVVPDDGDYARLKASAIPHPARETIPADTAVPHLQFWSLIFAIRKSSFQHVGGFDEAFTGYGAEDTDFAMSFHKAGLTQRFVSDFVLHQYHDKYNPPLNHFNAIISNAVRYRDKWGVFPMMKWLNGFAELGLITIDDISITVRRQPTETEIAASISTDPY